MGKINGFCFSQKRSLTMCRSTLKLLAECRP